MATHPRAASLIFTRSMGSGVIPTEQLLIRRPIFSVELARQTIPLVKTELEAEQ
jgi:hypothetical protein